jgi:hypothetical protein
VTSLRDLQHVTSLHDLQQAFASAVRFGDAAVIAGFVDANGIEPERRVGIYANNVRENFLATLEATYPVLLRLAGRDWFRQTGTAYLKLHPAQRQFALRRRAPSFLEATRAARTRTSSTSRASNGHTRVLVAGNGSALDRRAVGRPADATPTWCLNCMTARLVASTFPLPRSGA